MLARSDVAEEIGRLLTHWDTLVEKEQSLLRVIFHEFKVPPIDAVVLLTAAAALTVQRQAQYGSAPPGADVMMWHGDQPEERWLKDEPDVTLDQDERGLIPVRRYWALDHCCRLVAYVALGYVGPTDAIDALVSARGVDLEQLAVEVRNDRYRERGCCGD